MINIAQHIEYLLMHHDCVVVPGFGAFMVNHEPARYDASARCFLPPSRSLGFNPEVRHNDALLLGSISRREGISLDSARAALDTSLASMRHQMGICGEFHLGNLGVVTPGATPDAPVFNPSADTLSVRIHDGLQPVAVTPLDFDVDDSAEHSGKASSGEVTVIPFPLKVVASIVAILVCFGIIYSTTSLVNSPRINFASLDTGIGSRLERVLDSGLAVSREILLNIAMPPAETEEPAQRVARHAVALQPAAVGPLRYILVVGSFPTSEAANRFVKETGDSSLRVMEHEGNYRVYAGTADRINEARELAESVSEIYPNVWVCHR